MKIVIGVGKVRLLSVAGKRASSRSLLDMRPRRYSTQTHFYPRDKRRRSQSLLNHGCESGPKQPASRGWSLFDE